MRDFQADVIAAENQEKFWERFYLKAYPNLISSKVVKFEDNQAAQRNGIDRRLYLPNPLAGAAVVVTVEEKFRPSGGRMDFSNPSDILLEYENVYADGSRTIGWMNKLLGCDMLAYAWEDFGGGYIMPWGNLRLFVDDEGWRLGQYRTITAWTKGNDHRGNYETHSAAIPISEFFDNVSGFRLIKCES